MGNHCSQTVLKKLILNLPDRSLNIFWKKHRFLTQVWGSVERYDNLLYTYLKSLQWKKISQILTQWYISAYSRLPNVFFALMLIERVLKQITSHLLHCYTPFALQVVNVRAKSVMLWRWNVCVLIFESETHFF